MSDFTKLEKMIGDLTLSVGRLESEMGSMKSEMGSMKSEMQTGFRRLEGLILDTRDEMRSESTANRTLLNQAFTHISDQLVNEESASFVPKYPRSR